MAKRSATVVDRCRPSRLAVAATRASRPSRRLAAPSCPGRRSTRRAGWPSRQFGAPGWTQSFSEKNEIFFANKIRVDPFRLIGKSIKKADRIKTCVKMLENYFRFFLLSKFSIIFDFELKKISSSLIAKLTDILRIFMNTKSRAKPRASKAPAIFSSIQLSAQRGNDGLKSGILVTPGQSSSVGVERILNFCRGLINHLKSYHYSYTERRGKSGRSRSRLGRAVFDAPSPQRCTRCSRCPLRLNSETSQAALLALGTRAWRS